MFEASTYPLDETDERDAREIALAEYSTFIKAMKELHRSGLSYREAVEQFRAVVTAPAPGITEQDRAILLRIFEISVKKFEDGMAEVREIVAWVTADSEKTVDMDTYVEDDDSI